MFGFEGTTLPAHLKKWIQAGLGGIIYFARNIESPRQIKEMSDEAQSLAPQGCPLWIAVDQEGGRVRRLRPPHFSDIPTGQAMGALYQKDPAALERMVDLMAIEMRQVGINLDFAPVLDIHTNPGNPIIGDRAFSYLPDQVADVAQVFIDHFHENGILACGKHFPGHGDTDIDSHLDLPVIRHSLTRLGAVEWLPFQRAIAGGLRMIMTAHILFPEIDPNVPATLSPRILQGILRQQLGFNGVIITDDMGMKGIARDYGLLESSVLALKAGADVILACEQFDEQEALLHHIDKAMVDGVLKKDKIEASLSRIKQIKSNKNFSDFIIKSKKISC